jgi:hypothetical protein
MRAGQHTSSNAQLQATKLRQADQSCSAVTSNMYGASSEQPKQSL